MSNEISYHSIAHMAVLCVWKDRKGIDRLYEAWFARDILKIENCIGLPPLFNFKLDEGHVVIKMSANSVTIEELVCRLNSRYDREVADIIITNIRLTLSDIHANNKIHGALSPDNVYVNLDDH